MTENCCQLHSGHRTFVFSNNRNSESGKSAVFTNCRCLWILLRGAQGRGPAADQRVLSDEDSPQSQDRTSKTWPWPGGPAALLAPRVHPLRVPVWRVEQRVHWTSFITALRAECSVDLTHHCSQIYHRRTEQSVPHRWEGRKSNYCDQWRPDLLPIILALLTGKGLHILSVTESIFIFI